MNEAQDLFVADARDIVEKLYRDLEQLRLMRLHGRQRRELAGRIFRRVHTLKGSAASLELKSVSTISHEMEGVLDGLRLGRIELTEDLIDLITSALDAISRALDITSDEESLPTALLNRLKALATNSKKQGTIASSLRSVLPSAISHSLSEYDLQHAREAIREGARLFIIST